MASCWSLGACLAGSELETETDESAILGGTNAAAGDWPDVAAVLFDGQQVCTGTLIAPNVVLTAGHCNDPALTSVLIGTSSLARPSEGETIEVVKRVEFPSSQSTEDVTVLVLKRASRFAPRAIATGWARSDIKNAARVEIVGYGAIDRDASQFKNDLQQAETTITDADCTTKVGCRTAAQPAGELGAGGNMSIDTCNGDSGGPLYLLTDYGTFLAGVTSRAYDDSTFPCGEGGIYARPDKIVDWIEQQAGERVERGPEPTADKITAPRGRGGETRIAHNDPKSQDHALAVKQAPAHATIATRNDGRVRICNDGIAIGDDVAIVTVTDKHDATRAVDVRIPIAIQDGTATPDCDLMAFEDGDGGCCDSRRRATGSLPLGLVVLLVLRRRRR
jgi:secreted trypsin-like serine protease